MSNLLATSYGECIDSNGIPQSITSTPLLASIYAIVPPPPTSTFPNSANWYLILPNSMIQLRFLKYWIIFRSSLPCPLSDFTTRRLRTKT